MNDRSGDGTGRQTDKQTDNRLTNKHQVKNDLLGRGKVNKKKYLGIKMTRLEQKEEQYAI